MSPAYRDRLATNFIELARRITAAGLPPTLAGVEELTRRTRAAGSIAGAAVAAPVSRLPGQRAAARAEGTRGPRVGTSPQLATHQEAL
jgi:hypothetical protein